MGTGSHSLTWSSMPEVARTGKWGWGATLLVTSASPGSTVTICMHETCHEVCSTLKGDSTLATEQGVWSLWSAFAERGLWEACSFVWDG